MIENNAKRINPRRAYELMENGVKRIVLGATSDFIAHEAALQHGTSKPLRTPKQAKTRILVVAHSDRGTLDDHAKQCLAAAAILADANTAVVALVLGELHEDLTNTGADEVLVIAELDYVAFQPESELFCVKAVVETLQPSHIFMPDNLIGDGDLGRRLIASQPEKLAATHVIELNLGHIANYQLGGTVLALTNLPFIVLLAPETADTNLPFAASALKLDQALAHPVKDKVAIANYTSLGMQTIAAAKIANADEFIVKLADGYDTNIGDRGDKLSGGQRQRLSIARAVLKNPPILILDEATSALDTESEKLVQEAINNMMQNRTSIVIAHRLSTIRHADEIIVLQKGDIVERGNHDALIAQNGYYRKLIEMQEVK